MKWKKKIGRVSAVFLGAVFLIAAGAKVFQPGAFVEQIQLEELDFLFSAPTVALMALALETGLGTALILGVRTSWILGSTTLLVSFFLFLTGRNYWLVVQGLRDEDAACGCFGSILQRTPVEAFWQDLLLLVPLLLLAIWFRPSGVKNFPMSRLLLALALAVGIVLHVDGHPDLHFLRLANEVAGNNEREKFTPTTEYLLFIEGENVSEAQIYESRQSVNLLIVIPQFPDAVLLYPMTKVIATMPLRKILRMERHITLSLDAVLREEGKFKVESDGIHFNLRNLNIYLRKISP